MLVKKTECQCFAADVMQTSFHQLFPADNHVYCDLNNSYTSISLLNWAKRQVQANSDCQRHNGTDINHPVCVQVCILITF